jgi:hypothetical protein
MAKGRIWLPRFAADKEFVARKNIMIAGRKFEAGEVIDKSLLSTRQLRQMYDTRRVLERDPRPGTHAGDRKRQRDEIIRKPGKLIEEQVQQQLEAVEEKNEELTGEKLPATYSMKHFGGGRWWIIDQDGNKVLGPMKKAEAAERLQEGEK